LLVIVGDGSRFPTAAHLASYAGLAPVTRQSGSSIGSQRAPRRGNLQVRQIFFFAAVASLVHDPQSRRYYDRKRAEGKRATAALLCLARRKANLLHAMLRNGSLYRAPLADDVAEPRAA
jgi:transposase